MKKFFFENWIVVVACVAMGYYSMPSQVQFNHSRDIYVAQTK